jgi:uncharacterized membrane-anchored protein
LQNLNPLYQMENMRLIWSSNLSNAGLDCSTKEAPNLET